MALIICTECGKEFSDKAVSCPNCGCPTAEILVGSSDMAEDVESRSIFDDIYERFPDDRVSAAKEFQKIKGCTFKQAKRGIDNFYDAKTGFKKKGFWESVADSANNSKKADKPKVIRGGLKCPKCGSHDIDLWSNSANTKEFQRTGLNLNPLHPLTPFKTKNVKKEKTSAAKIGLGVMTGGISLVVTGTKKKAHNEYYCRNCGNKWIGK